MAISLDELFSIANGAAVIGWLVLVLVPLRFPVRRAVATLVVAPLAMLYAALIGAFWVGSEGGFQSLTSVAELFEHRGLLLAGWVHYLAFDLLVGLWEREEAARIDLPQWLLAPCLVLTFLFGPLGWLLFRGVRQVRSPTLARASVA